MQQRVLYLEGEMVVHVPVQHCHCTCLPFMHMNDIWLTSGNLQQSSPNKPIPNCKLLEATFVDKKKVSVPVSCSTEQKKINLKTSFHNSFSRKCKMTVHLGCQLLFNHMVAPKPGTSRPISKHLKTELRNKTHKEAQTCIHSRQARLKKR